MIFSKSTKKTLDDLLSDGRFEEVNTLIERVPIEKRTVNDFLIHYSSLMETDKKKAYTILEDALLIFPKSIELRIKHAEYAMSLCQWDMAIDRWQFIITNISGYSTGVYWRQARAYLYNKQFEGSRQAVLKIISIEGSSQKSDDFLSLIDSEQSQKYRVLIKNSGKDIGGIEYRIESLNKNPEIMSLESLKKYRLRGWIRSTFDNTIFLIVRNENQRTVYKLNIDRFDVKEHFSRQGKEVSIRCGYDYIIDISKKTEIGFLINNKEYWPIFIDKSKVINVLRGSDNWLFLANDTNRSVDQFTGKVTLNEDQIKSWMLFSKKLSIYQIKTKFLYIIANSKEKVFPQYYPFDMSDRSLTEVVESIFIENQVEYINPRNVLRRNEYSYYKTDTHWSDLGAYIAYREVLNKTDNIDYIEEPEFTDVEVIGDLGSKLSPRERTIKKKFKNGLLIEPNLVFHNKLSKTGAIKVLVNNEINNNKTVLIFGGSSMENFSPYFSYSFHRVITINLPGSVVDEIVDFEKPDLLLMQTNERYLISPGKVFKTFYDSPLYKVLSKIEDKKKNEILESMMSSDNEIFYRKLTIEALTKK